MRRRRTATAELGVTVPQPDALDDEVHHVVFIAFLSAAYGPVSACRTPYFRPLVHFYTFAAL
jgi:hypothetical protein